MGWGELGGGKKAGIRNDDQNVTPASMSGKK